MTLSTLLQSMSLALIAIALLFLLKGAARMSRLVRSRLEADGATAQREVVRRRALRRADRSCAFVLLAVALMAFVVGRVGSGPLFTEPSGNRAGGVVLIVVIGSVVLLAALIVRHFVLSRALRRLKHPRR